MDLSQAEAVADIIAADSRAAYAVASTQMRGGYSAALAALRERLVRIVSLLELELDFSEEDVEFADRTELSNLLNELRNEVNGLCGSFALGNALKHGVTVAIAGRPNVGKSTLLNALAGEDRAMVSAIAGTTRDTVEVVKNLGGVNYRFVDTAGLHDTADELERMGIERTTEAMRRAMIILWLTDDENGSMSSDLAGYAPSETQKIYRVLTKSDIRESADIPECAIPTIAISAKTGAGMAELQQVLLSAADARAAYAGDVIVSNRRHYDALCQAEEALTAALNGLQMGIPTDLLSEDIRQVVHHIGHITGEISSDDILHSIFANFCIGK
jgi:tRNA modification GTPase